MRRIELGCVQIGENAKKYVMDVLESNRLSAGPYIRRFEERFATAHECAHAIMCNSGTSALQIALAALKEQFNFKDGDEVIVPAVTFVATSNIVLQNHMVPVFVDIDPHYYTIHPSLIEERITKKTKVIIPVHLFGLPCEMDSIMEIARHHRLATIEDSCEAMFTRYKGKSVGSFGEAACFSTYVAHFLVTGVGGLITTQSDGLATLCRSVMAHGRDPLYLNIDDDDDVADHKRFSEIIRRRFSFVRMGYSFRVTEMEGALGVAMLEQKDDMMSKRRRNASYLIQQLKDLEEFIQLPTWSPYADHSFMMFPLVVRKGVKRDDLVIYLERHGIETRFMMPLLTQPFYRKLFGNLEKQYPVAMTINRQGFYIGCHQGLGKDDLDYVAEVFHSFFRTRRA